MESLAAALQCLAKQTGPRCTRTLPDLYDGRFCWKHQSELSGGFVSEQVLK